jgi:ferredoxin--NADP+ reductase
VSTAPPSIAIVGSGPAGLYAAEGLIKKLPDARIDVLDRLPTPFGLVRFGVAPDHQGTKAIQRQFDKLLQRPTLRFLGNVAVGRDVGVDELRGLYDAVVLAMGAPVDRRLGIPGEDLAGVYGSGAFVGWFNGHPDHAGLASRLDGTSVAVIGNGNVAIDVARVLAKTPAEMAASDLCAHAAEVISRAPLTDIWLIGRRGAGEASWTPVELAELGRLERASPVVDAADIPERVDEPDPKLARIREKNLEILKGFAAMPADKPLRLHFLFHAAPVAVLGQGAASALRLERTRIEDGRSLGTGETFEIPAQTIVSAIGYRCDPLDGVALDERTGIVRNDDGRVAPSLWAVGWAKRGPSGTIPTNRADSFAVADHIAAALASAQCGKGGCAGLDALIAARNVEVVDYDGWRRIEAVEAARARPGAPREKLTTRDELLTAAREGESAKSAAS